MISPLSVTPAISVILPVFNGQAFLREAIDSILSQTFADFELIVVNDASTDGTDAILASYEDRRIRIVRHPSNLGIVAALNGGLRIARGEIIARMDADDISMPDRFARQHAFLAAHPEVGLLGTWIKAFGAVRASYVERYPESDQEIRALMLFENPFAHSSIMIRKNLLLQHDMHYPGGYRYVEDWALWIQLSKVTTMSNIPAPLVKYRINKMGSSYQGTKIQTESRSRLMNALFADLGLRYSPVLATPPASMADLHALSLCFSEIMEQARHAPVPAGLGRCMAELWLKACKRMRVGPWEATRCYLNSPLAPRGSVRLSTAVEVFLNVSARYMLALLSHVVSRSGKTS